MEVLPVSFAGDKGIFAGIDDFLQSSLGTSIILGEEQGLTLEGIGEALGNLGNTVLVRGGFPFIKVRNGFFALLGYPFEKVIM